MTGLRAKQKFARNNRILEAASALFRKSGYEAAKIEAIAEASDVSAGTIYNYYKNKGDLLVAIVSMEVNEVLQAGEALLEHPPLDAVKALNALVDIYYKHSLVYLSKEMWRVAISISTQQSSSPFGIAYSELDDALVQQTCAVIEKLQALKLLRSDVDAKLIGQVVFNNLNMMFMGFIKDEEMQLQKLRRLVHGQNRAILLPLV
jgi:AcrR family transcriptional regulator